MKQIIYFITFICGFTMASLHAQQYHPFPEENAYWTVVEFDQEIWAWDTFIYTIKGDTSVNTKDYKKIFRLNDIPGSSDTIWELHSFMRQDSAYKKVWFIRHYMGETIEKLGYDFDAENGDTVYLPAFDYENIGDSVFVLATSVFDSALLHNGEYRKKYFFESTYPNIDLDLDIIEGVGTWQTPFPNLLYYDAFHQSETVCLTVDEIYLYGASPYSDECGFTVNISENQISEQVMIRHDVKNKELSITTNESSISNINIKLINILGYTVISQQISHLTNEYSIDVSHLNTGVYIIFIQANSNLNITKKLFIQN